MEFQQNKPGGDSLTRLAVCVVIGVAAIYAAEKLCEEIGRASCRERV